MMHADDEQGLGDHGGPGAVETPRLGHWWWAVAVGLMLAAVVVWWVVSWDTWARREQQAVDQQRASTQPVQIDAREVRPVAKE